MNFKLSLFLGLLVFSATAQTNTSLADLLWKRAGGRPTDTSEEGAQMVVTEDSSNGYLKIERTEEGCGCYYETTIAAYKEADAGHTILQTEWDGCGWRKTISSNKELTAVLPEDFGLATFISTVKANSHSRLTALLYLEVAIPKKGTDTAVTLAFVPIGFHFKGDDFVLSYSGYEQKIEDEKPNYQYRDDLWEAISQLRDSTTLGHILYGQPDQIRSEDKKVLDELMTSTDSPEKEKLLSTYISILERYYKIYKAIEYDTVILGWNRETERFYIKDKMKRTGKVLSFLEFVQQLPYLVAIC